MKRLGPELKMPDLANAKAPAWATDLYYDMRDRRLLPLIALVVVAIAAVPFLLGDSETEVPPPVAEEGAVAEGAAGADGATLAVVEATPGLRDYKKRLKRRSPTDPFVQKYTAVPPEAKLESVGPGSGGGGGEEEVSVTVTERGTSDGSPGGGGGTAPKPGGGSGSAGSGDRTFYAYRPNVRFGIAGSGELTNYRHLDFGKPLPKRNPVILFFGVSEGGDRVAFDVSPEVQLVKTKGRCIGGHRSCGTLILKEGQAATILTGKPNRSFRLKITGIDFIEVKRPKPQSSSGKREERIGFGSSVVGQFQNPADD